MKKHIHTTLSSGSVQFNHKDIDMNILKRYIEMLIRYLKELSSRSIKIVYKDGDIILREVSNIYLSDRPELIIITNIKIERTSGIEKIIIEEEFEYIVRHLRIVHNAYFHDEPEEPRPMDHKYIFSIKQ